MATVYDKYQIGTQYTLISGAALANNALASGVAFNNLVGGGQGDGYWLGRVTFKGTFAGAPTASTALSLWFLTSEDNGATYEDGSPTYTPDRIPDLVIPVGSGVANANQKSMEGIIPVGWFIPLLKNDGTGQQINSGWTLKLLPITDSSV